MTLTALIQLTRCDLLSDWPSAGQGLMWFCLFFCWFFKLGCLYCCYFLYMLIPPSMLTITDDDDVLSANQYLYRSINSVLLRVVSCWQ